MNNQNLTPDWEMAAAQTKSGSILWCYQLNYHQIGHVDPYLSQLKESDIVCPMCQEKLEGESSALATHQERVAKRFNKNATKEAIEKTYLKPEDQKRIALTKLTHPHNHYCPTREWGMPMQILFFGHLVEEPIHLSNLENELGAEEAMLSTLGKNRKRVAPSMSIVDKTVKLQLKEKTLVQYQLQDSDLGFDPEAAIEEDYPVFDIDPKKLASDVHTWPVRCRNSAAKQLPWRVVKTMRQHLKGIKEDEKDQLQKRLLQIPQGLIWERAKRNEPYQEGAVERWWFNGVGDPRSETWVLGLYPSNEEMRHKRIYAGKTGILLNQVIEEAAAADPTGAFTSSSVYLDNIIKSFRPGKSKISAYDKAEQFWLLKRQLAYFKPKRVICLGAEAWKALAGDKLGAAKYRGNWLDVKIDIQKEIDAGIDRVIDPECPTVWEGQVSNSWSPAYILRPEGADSMPIFRQQMVNLFLGKEKKKIEFPWSEIRTREEAQAWAPEDHHPRQGGEHAVRYHHRQRRPRPARRHRRIRLLAVHHPLVQRWPAHHRPLGDGHLAFQRETRSGNPPLEGLFPSRLGSANVALQRHPERPRGRDGRNRGRIRQRRAPRQR